MLQPKVFGLGQNPESYPRQAPGSGIEADANGGADSSQLGLHPREFGKLQVQVVQQALRGPEHEERAAASKVSRTSTRNNFSNT